MELMEKKIASKEIFKGKVVRLRVDDVRLPNGAASIREVIDHPGGVCVAVLTKNDELLFVRQFRYAYEEVVLELPAGKLEPGENIDPLEACKREQKEETGTTSSKYLDMGKLYPSPGYCNEIIHLYACRAESYGETRFDEDEFLEVERIPVRKAVDMVLNGEIRDSKTQVLILKVWNLLQEKKI